MKKFLCILSVFLFICLIVYLYGTISINNYIKGKKIIIETYSFDKINSYKNRYNVLLDLQNNSYKIYTGDYIEGNIGNDRYKVYLSNYLVWYPNPIYLFLLFENSQSPAIFIKDSYTGISKRIVVSDFDMEAGTAKGYFMSIEGYLE